MRKFLIILFFVFQYKTFAQKIGEQAIFKECEKDAFPIKCTESKIEADIIALVTPEIISEIEKTAENYFSVCIAFTTDENGKAITSGTEIKCANNQALKKSIEDYIATLPVFLPKDITQKERRSVHIINIVFSKKDAQSKYQVMNGAEASKIIMVPRIFPDTAPVFRGCDKITGDILLMKCYYEGIRDHIVKNYQVPVTLHSGKAQLMITFLLTPMGKIVVEDVTGNATQRYKDAVVKTMNRLSKIQPATKNGIPVPLRSYMPLNIKIGK